MPAVAGIPAETPCVCCHATPTVGYCHAGVQTLAGRVCAEHAEKLAAEGRCVVGGHGLVENWGRC
jgi:hypothetical protein